MVRKIVAIGGGENGRIRSNGTKAAYETKEIDSEIIRLTGKAHPNFLFICHAQPLENQESYFKCMENIYNKIFGCQCQCLKSNDLKNIDKVTELIEWSDIIYEGGGDTLNMIKLWNQTGFDKILRKAWEQGKVLCGVSAGANCWFDSYITDSLRIMYKDNTLPLTRGEGLGFVPGFFVPHCDSKERTEASKNILKENNMTGIFISNCAAIEIIDNQYRLITSQSADPNFKSYGLVAYWDKDNYIEQSIIESNELKDINSINKTCLSKKKK